MTDEDPPVPPGGRPVVAPVWEPWDPDQLPELLRGVTAPWYVAGGWAIDLFRGEQTREHEDLEIGLPGTPEAFGQIRRALADYDLEVIGSGLAWPLDSPAFEVMHQTWVSEQARPVAGGPSEQSAKPLRVYRLDIFREPQRHGRWVCRRDERIELPYDEVIRHSANGIPYLAPHLGLLFKAKHARPKDAFDLTGTLPRLTDAERDWLARTLRQVQPGHDWLGLI